jgi:hypothetical protein
MEAASAAVTPPAARPFHLDADESVNCATGNSLEQLEKKPARIMRQYVAGNV